MNISKIIEIVSAIILILFVLWGILSWIEVLTYSVGTDHAYNSLNMFIMFLKLAGR